MPKGAWETPEAGNAPEGAKSILKKVYASCRDSWAEKNPDNIESKANKISCASIAWSAVKKAGYHRDAKGEWKLKEEDIPEGIQIGFVALSDPGTEEFSEHKIFYPGQFKHQVFGDFKVDEKKLRNAADNFELGAGVLLDEKGEGELNCTYEHPPSSESDPEKTKSSGRIKRLFLKDGALYALVRWTDKAKEYIKNKEFTHVSPTFQENWKDENGNSHGFTLRGLGLTNVPFLKKGQMAIALSETDLNYINKEDNKMDQKIHEILGLKEDGNVAEAVRDLKEKSAKVETLETEIKKLTEAGKQVEGLQKQVKELTEKLEASKPKDGEVKLTEEQYQALKSGAETALELKKELELKEVDALVDQGIKDFKILPAQKEQARKMALTDRSGFTEFLKNAKPVINATENGSDGDGLSDSAASLVKKIEAHAAKEKISFTEAKRQLKEQNPAEFKEAGY